MGIIVNNVLFSVRFSLTILKLVGLWAPEELEGRKKMLYYGYGTFCFMMVLGAYILFQMVDLIHIWGDLPLMTAIAFLMCTNLAQVTKILNLLVRRKQIKAIIDEADQILRSVDSEGGKTIVDSCNRETKIYQLFFIALTTATALGWAVSAEKNTLPLRAWYPYDTTQSPAFELTFCHQFFGLIMTAYMNISKDTLVTALMAQCTCRLRLLGYSLKTLCQDLHGSVGLRLTPSQEEQVSERLRRCVNEHQAVLHSAKQLQKCFSEPTFAQFTVSLVIICVTAFQMVSCTGNLVRLVSMGAYLLNMMFQVFIYCYYGNQLSEESTEVAGYAYESGWCACGTRLRRALLVLMTRCRRAYTFTAGNFILLSLVTFMAMIKASYSLFTLLKQVDEK